MTDAAAFIRTRLRLTPVPGLPSICLHTAYPGSGLGRLERDAPPYWAHPWGGGLALARYLREHPEAVAGRRVIDLGCGSGLVGIAAAQAGAAQVTAVDVDPFAVAAAQVNAVANGVGLEALCTDLTEGEPPEADLIAAGDVFYDAVVAARMAPFLTACAAAGAEVLIGDPLRAWLPEGLQELARYEVPDFGGTRGPGIVCRMRI